MVRSYYQCNLCCYVCSKSFQGKNITQVMDSISLSQLVYRIPQVPFEANFPCNDTFADLMSYVSTENFKNYLLQASTKHSSTPTNGDVEFKDISGEVHLSISVDIFE